jgi:hypothetical protein
VAIRDRIAGYRDVHGDVANVTFVRFPMPKIPFRFALQWMT